MQAGLESMETYPWKVWKHIETNQIWNNQSKWLMGTAVDDLSPQDWTVAAQWSEAVPSRTLGTSSASLEQARCEDFQAWVTWLGGESCELWHHFSDI